MARYGLKWELLVIDKSLFIVAQRPLVSLWKPSDQGFKNWTSQTNR